MKDLIEALNIFLKYKQAQFPTHCEHDILYIMQVTREEVSAQDVERLDELGFHWNKSLGLWASYRFGSA